MRQRIKVSRTTGGNIKSIDKTKPKKLYPRTKLREEPRIVWSPIYGVKTDNGNYVFFRKAQWSRNVFWYNKKKPIEKDGLYYMPPRFHKVIGWVFLTKENRLAVPKKVIWGDAKEYLLPNTRLLNEKTVERVIEELEKIMKYQ